MPASTTRRVSLLRKLDAALTHRLLLLVGSHGPRDRLLKRWIGRHQWQAAWVELVAADNSPEVFLADVSAALGGIALEPERQDGWRSAEVGRDAIAFLNSLAGVARPFYLELAGYELIRDPAVHAVVSSLVDYPPPSGHLILAAEREPPLPLARWRARREATLVRLPSIKLHRRPGPAIRKT